MSWSSGNEVFRSTAVAMVSLGVMGIVNVMIATAIRNVTIVNSHMVNGDSGGDQLARESSGIAESQAPEEKKNWSLLRLIQSLIKGDCGREIAVGEAESSCKEQSV